MMGIEVKRCPVCGKEFTDKSGRRTYCSPECKKEGGKRVRAAWLEAHRVPVKYTRKHCLMCQELFTPVSPNQKYCSAECAATVSRLQTKRRDERQREERRVKAALERQKSDAALNAAMQKLRREQCVSCKWQYKDAGNSYCNYYCTTGKRREKGKDGWCLSYERRSSYEKG